MPASLVTGWKCIATSGPTIDGRYIKEEWLTDMAETYDPAFYTAKIWVDHSQYWSYGSVRELKSEQDGDVVRLFAKISPTDDLLYLNRVWEQKLHFSIEPLDNFAKTGKTYLGGLAMTDIPASVGTDEMRFAKQDNEHAGRYPGEPVPDLRKMFNVGNDQAQADTTQILGLLGKLAALFSGNHTPPKEEKDAMDEKRFSAVESKVNNFEQTLNTFNEKLDALIAGKDGKTDAAAAGTGTEAEQQAQESFSKADGDALLQAVDKLTQGFHDFAKQMKEHVPGTEFEENTGGDDSFANIA